MMGSVDSSEDIVKNDTDPKTYRVIKLENGLTALLISEYQPEQENDKMSSTASDEDLSGPHSDSEGSTKPSGSSTAMDEENATFGAEDDDQMDDSEGNSILKRRSRQNFRSVHRRSLRGQKTDTDTNNKYSTAALCVGVGSMSDPDDIPGLAHFLEHMVFMGSKKYPKENDFDLFIKKYGGTTNANTEYERTHFKFEIQSGHFKQALDRWAQFFIHPLIKESSMESEAKVVHSEWAMGVQKDKNQFEQLLMGMSKPGHPFNRFMWGNIESLIHKPRSQNINVHAALNDFFRKYYLAQHMTLTVMSGETLDELQQWVTEIFSDIPSNNEKKFDFGTLGDPFDTPEFRRIYRVYPVQNLHQVELTWSLPSLVKHYRVRPLFYIERLVGDLGEGSIYSSLHKRLWIREISAGNTESDQDHNSAYACFRIVMTLTEEGLANFKKAITVVFQYLRMMRTVGAKKELWEEMYHIDQTKFKFDDIPDVQDYVDQLCMGMQRYEPKDYLIASLDFIQEYDDKLITECLDMLRPDKMNITVRSKTFKDVCNLTEKWFRTPYRVDDIPKEWLAEWKDPPADTKQEFSIPKKNIYIAEDFELKQPEPDMREKVDPPFKDTILSRLWYKFDNEFGAPKAFVHFYLWSKNANRTPTELAMSDLFVRILTDRLKEDAHAATLAGLNYFVNVYDGGMTLRISGYNHKLKNLFETCVRKMATFHVSDDVFNMMKKELSAKYRNNMICPERLNKELRRSLLNYYYWTALQKSASLTAITKDMFLDYISNLHDGMFVESLFQGNITSQEALAYEKHLIEKLHIKPITSADSVPKTYVTEIRPGCSLHAIPNLNEDDENSVITNYYQIGKATMREQVLTDLLVMNMEEPLFAELRTQKNLGYEVSARRLHVFGIQGFSITICSQATKFTMPTGISDAFQQTKCINGIVTQTNLQQPITNDFTRNPMRQLDDSIEEFLSGYNGRISRMKEADFQNFIDSVISLKDGFDGSLKDQVDRYWLEILHHQYEFDRAKLEAVELNDITLQEFKDWSQSIIPVSAHRKKLSVQVIGHIPKDKVEIRCHGNCKRDPPSKPIKKSEGLDYNKLPCERLYEVDNLVEFKSNKFTIVRPFVTMPVNDHKQ